MQIERLLQEVVFDNDDVRNTSEAMAFVFLHSNNGLFFWDQGKLRYKWAEEPKKSVEPSDDEWSKNRDRYRRNLRRFKEENIGYLSSFTAGYDYSPGFLEAIGNKFLNEKRQCMLELLPDVVDDEWFYYIKHLWMKLQDFIRQEAKTHPFHVENARRIVANFEALPVFAKINPPPVVVPGLEAAAKSLFAEMFRKEKEAGDGK